MTSNELICRGGQVFKRALLAFLALPGMVALLAPVGIVVFDPWRGKIWLIGLFVLLAGLGILIWCVRDFYVVGKGTLAPWCPPENLVIVGLYRYVRNPMYIGVIVLVAGWALLFLSPLVAGYLILLALAFHIRVVRYEEPWLESRFGTAWRAYCNQVPRWLPRYSSSDKIH
jgi:protein-S-isoprenylcysteine O-methyltransferase Ste14